MTTKHVFAMFGTANVGKSTTLKKVFGLLTSAYPNAPVQSIYTGIDITVIIEICGVFVGIETQGDPNGRLAESLELFKKAKCSIIICATRTSGGTVDEVESLHPEYNIVWHHKTSESQVSLRDRKDTSIAQTIFSEVQDALKASPCPAANHSVHQGNSLRQLSTLRTTMRFEGEVLVINTAGQGGAVIQSPEFAEMEGRSFITGTAVMLDHEGQSWTSGLRVWVAIEHITSITEVPSVDEYVRRCSLHKDRQNAKYRTMFEGT